MLKLTTIRSLSETHDQSTISEFLFAMKEEFLLPDQAAVDDVIQVLFERGGIVGLYKDERLVGFIGYLLGDPAENYMDKKVGFLYIMGIARQYRLTRVGYDLFRHTMREFERLGLREIRLQAEATNLYTNRLYSRFAKPVGYALTRRGAKVMSYQCALRDVLSYWEKPARFKALFARQQPKAARPAVQVALT